MFLLTIQSLGGTNTLLEVKQCNGSKTFTSIKVERNFYGSKFYFHESKQNFVEVKFASMETFLLP